MAKETEYEFLPAALEIQETPPSPIGRWIIWSIGILFCLAVIWALLGKVDIVAIAQGKIIHTDKSKTIQSLQAGSIKAIHVKEGLQVEKGDLLIELDGTFSSADKLKLEEEQQALTWEKNRIKFFMDLLDFKVQLSSLSELELPASHQLLLGENYKAYQENLTSLEEGKRKAESEIELINTQISRFQGLLPIITKRYDIYEKMAKKGVVSKVEYLKIQEEKLGVNKTLEAEKAKRKVATSSVIELESKISALRSETLSKSLQRTTEIDNRLMSLKSELSKASQQQFYENLTSPIDGTVQQLAVNTLGGVVTAAQPLMVIVPVERELVVEAKLQNKDIGFVYEKQHAAVKVDAFNFTKYGLIDGEVISISDDAIDDEQLGLVYSTRVKLAKDQLNIDGKLVTLSPGMSVAVEIKTGKRKLIEYFLSPILRYKQESIKER